VLEVSAVRNPFQVAGAVVVFVPVDVIDLRTGEPRVVAPGKGNEAENLYKRTN